MNKMIKRMKRAAAKSAARDEYLWLIEEKHNGALGHKPTAKELGRYDRKIALAAERYQ